MSKETTSGGGIGIVSVLLIIFIVLKLTGNIDWSWWWVLSPLWICCGLILVVVLIVFIVMAIFAAVSKINISKKWRKYKYGK